MKVKINESMFILSIFIIEFATYANGIIYLNKLYMPLVGISMVILFFLVINNLIKLKVSYKMWIIFFSMFVVCVISYFYTRDTFLLQAFFIIIAAIGNDFIKILKSDLIFKVFLFIFIYINGKLGYSYMTESLRDGRIRYTLGFSHPNALGSFSLFWYLEYLYLINSTKKRRILKILIPFFIVNYVTNSLAYSRTSFYLVMIITIIYILNFVKLNIKTKNVKKLRLPLWVLLVVNLLTILCTFSYINNSSMAVKLNETLSNRPKIQAMYYEKYGISILGNNIQKEIGASLDNAYFRLLINYGITGWLFFMFILYLNFYTGLNEKKYDYVIILVLLIIYGISEWYIIKPAINLFLLYNFCNKENKEKNNEKSINFNNYTSI